MTIRRVLFSLAAFAVIALSLVLAVACDTPTNPDDLTDPVQTQPNPDGPGTGEPKPEPEPEEPESVITTMVIDFQDSVAGICDSAFEAAGVVCEPGAGQLDADAWSITGFTDGDQAFGEERTAGDLARGNSTGGVSTGGVYAFTVEPDNVALGVQPTGTDFAPGAITLRFAPPEGPVTGCTVSFRLWILNNEDRSTAWSAWWSTDGETWTEMAGTIVTTPVMADDEPVWTGTFTSSELGDQEPAIGGAAYLYVQWRAQDGNGLGSRDECAIDDVTVTFTSDGQ